MPIRIYALAKELGIENKQLVDICFKNIGDTGKYACHVEPLLLFRCCCSVVLLSDQEIYVFHSARQRNLCSSAEVLSEERN